MDVLAGHRAPHRALRSPAIAIGNFDGIHHGHAALLARAKERAAATGGEVVVLTFDPHPTRVLVPHLAPPLLTTTARKLELLAAAGVDAVVVEPFTAELAALPAPAFITEVLVRSLGARHLIVGHDFSYGQARSGTVETLAAEGACHGFTVDVVAAVTVDGEVASSSRIRRYLRGGDLARATALLGRPWDIDGVVVRGAGRGKGLGIPTANIAPAGDLLVAPGIYAVTLACKGPGAAGPARPAVASLGTNPTFVDAGALTLEVHVLDFDADLYDAEVRVALIARLRDEARYDTVDALLRQIDEDIAQARVILRAPKP